MYLDFGEKYFHNLSVNRKTKYKIVKYNKHYIIQIKSNNVIF